MATASQNSAGCWTCRLRRKKCDQTRPICGVCAALEISCYSELRKPEWMDNGARQQEMVQQLKRTVKRSAARRRSRRLIQRVTRDLDAEEDAQIPITGPDSSAESNTARAISDPPTTGVAQATPDYSTTLDSSYLFQRFDSELELQFVMIYLDHAFPVLFPFYTPAIFEGGRGWLLVLPMKIRALYHTVISLTSYFFSAVPISPGPAQDICSSIACDERDKQLDLAVQCQGVHSDLLESSYLLGSIVQLLIFEGLVATTENWRIHLDAAVVLFEQMIQPSGTVSSLLDLMRRRSSLPSKTGDNMPWNADQAAFRFYSTVLLLADIISSTALEQPPKLHKYHDDLLLNNSTPGHKAPLQSEDAIGCQSWALHLISEIAALAAWKKDMKKRRTLTTTQLVQRASIIEQKIEDCLSQLTSANAQNTQLSTPPLDNTVNTFTFTFTHHPHSQSTIETVTLIWAHAARIYLHIVLSGWQTAILEIRASVTSALKLFANLPSPTSLRALAWPFCVVGCVAEEEEEFAFREIIRSMGPLGRIGTMQTALRVMENVWRRREETDFESDRWDIAACLGGLGFVVLLV
ncbi:fungal-specific transcription factor domain-containing protein [Aspergillus spectabilis]